MAPKPDESALAKAIERIGCQILDAFESTALCNSAMQPANVVDGLGELAGAGRKLAEAVDKHAAALVSLANAIDHHWQAER